MRYLKYSDSMKAELWLPGVGDRGYMELFSGDRVSVLRDGKALRELLHNVNIVRTTELDS